VFVGVRMQLETDAANNCLCDMTMFICECLFILVGVCVCLGFFGGVWVCNGRQRQHKNVYMCVYVC